MRKFGKGGLVLAMEEDEAAIAAPESEIPEAIVDLEESAGEASAEVGEIEDMHEAIESAEADAETLGDIRDTMQEAVDSGEGIPESAAAIADVAVEAICDRLGIRREQPLVPATENFGSQGSRLAATKIAIEGIGDSIKRIWESIKKALLAAWEKIKAFFNTYFTSLGRARTLLEALKKRQAEFKEEGTAEAIKNKQLAGSFNIEGNAGFAQAKEILDNHITFTGAALKAKDVLIDVVKGVADGAKSGNFDIDFEGIDGKFESYAKGLASGAGVMVGGTTIKAQLEKPTAKATIVKWLTEEAKKPVEEIAPLKKSEVATVLAKVGELLNRADEYKKEQSKFDGISKAMVSVVDSIISAADKIAGMAENKAEAKEGEDASKQVIASVRSALQNTTTLVPALNLRAIQAGLKYADLSMKAYKAAPAAKEGEAA